MGNAFVMASLPPKSQRSYSTTEQWTGEYWIDRKKIYKKTFSGGTLSIGKVTLEQNDQINRIVKSEFYYSTAVAQFAPSGGFISNRLDVSWIWINAVSYNLSTKNLEAIFTGGTSPSLVEWVVTVYYTKTTD